MLFVLYDLSGRTVCYESGDGFSLTETGKKTVQRKGGSICFSWRGGFRSVWILSADPLTCQPSGEYDTGICGNQHDHGKVRMRTADDKRTLRRSRGAVHSRISHGRHDGSSEALPWTGQNVGSAARGNRLLPCVCCCIFPVYAVEKKGKIHCRVKLQMEEHRTEVDAFFDTGNGLYDSVLQV